MDYRRTGKHIVLRLDEDEEIVHSVLQVCNKEKIESAVISGIGALKKAELSHFDTNKMEYHSKTFHGMLEITSLNGNIAVHDGKILLHAHITIAGPDFTAHGGHLKEAVVNPTCEIVITPIETKIRREKDEKTGLNLQKF